MKNLTRRELIDKYLKFFEEKGHKIIPSASLIPENDPTVLFTTAGMHPLVPYLLGTPHPMGKRLVDVQKCMRTSDIDSVGDDTHCTFFEMLGNWSLGDYFKDEAIKWSFEFLTDDKYLAIPLDKLTFSVFEGNENAPRDNYSAEVWKSLGVKEENIYFLSKEHNWWELGSGEGPCGPDTEMFVKVKECNNTNCTPSENCGCMVEIWNDVFMEYLAKDGKYTPLEHKNVDTGLGVERVLMTLNNLTSVYDIEVFKLAREKIEELTNTKYEGNKKEYRIVLDHIRTATFVLGDDIKLTPSNTGRGYVLRRLLRRAIRYIKKVTDKEDILKEVSKVFIEYYKNDYEELGRNSDYILNEIEKETNKFNKTITSGMKMFNKTEQSSNGIIDGEHAFKLFDTFGFPLEFTLELAKEKGLEVDVKGFEEKMKEHQELSRTASKGEFKGGLADTSYESTKYHTLAHIMLAELKKMFGEEVIQKGQNITPERLRFDFPLDHKMTEEEKEELTNRVNEVIKKGIDVTREEMTYDEAKKAGAEGIFTDKYGNIVSVYTIGDVSKEICGGPHVKNTRELGTFKIIKEESSAAGIRRLKVILEDK